MIRSLVFHALFALGVAGLTLPAQAQFTARPEAPAFGQTDGVVGCDLTEAGLVVSFAASVPSPFNGIANQGDPCLVLIAAFPPPYPQPLGFAQLNGNGDDQTVLIGADQMVWVVYDPKGVEAVIACALNEYGVLETVLVENGNGGAGLGGPCFETLDAFMAQGGQVRGPIAATLGDTTEGGSGGGIAWFNSQKSFGFVEMVICDVDPDDGRLKVTFHDTSDLGVIDSVGQSCLTIIAEDVEGEAPATMPLPIPVPRAAAAAVDVPDCIIWIIEGPGVN